MIFNINLTRGQMQFLTCVARVTCLVIDNLALYHRTQNCSIRLEMYDTFCVQVHYYPDRQKRIWLCCILHVFFFTINSLPMCHKVEMSGEITGCRAF